jgi:hypothetical protein
MNMAPLPLPRWRVQNDAGDARNEAGKTIGPRIPIIDASIATACVIEMPRWPANIQRRGMGLATLLGGVYGFG